ncbi:Retrovirus-related Pol polyprotein from type-2 retrotransposable element R2DM [Aphis craccivora]|uniref:Retrovirus-related Pol polyprotein from type-2 retrotransposable element R2DM n=1 Tax=Aphis craccivora TaxID=307492 RepID=A0A6G0XYL7_APHCR|nr:Retrovirus-related Pol polyprotein from type-2 retrotransposable element R2DM [Aphis craccivora]
MRYTALYMARYNAIVAKVKKAMSSKFEVPSENQVLGNQGLRPDLVLKKSPIIYIVDVTMPFNNHLEAFKIVATEKVKYDQLRAELAVQHGCTAVVVSFVVGALGSYDPWNHPFMRVLCSQSYAALIRRLCVSDTIR